MLVASSQKTLIYSYLFDAVVEVTFCGTPHRGSIWANRLFALSLRQSPSFVNLLRRGTPHSLSDIADKFNNVWGQKPILTFIEKKGVPILGVVSHSHFMGLSSLLTPQRLFEKVMQSPIALVRKFFQSKRITVRWLGRMGQLIHSSQS